jgi:hypothetical protein
LAGGNQQAKPGLEVSVVVVMARVPLVSIRGQPVVVRADVVFEIGEVREGGRGDPWRAGASGAVDRKSH